MLVLVGLASLNFPYGISGDDDAYAVLSIARGFSWWGYVPSRSFGFPGYELIAYPLLLRVGFEWAKAYSLACASLAVLAMWSVLRAVRTDRKRALVAALGFAGLPVMVIAGNTVMETAQGIALVLLGIRCALRWVETRRSADLFLTAALLGFATATRPDEVVPSAATALTVVAFARPSAAVAVAAALVYIACALGPFAIYTKLPPGLGTVLSDPLLERTGRAAVGIAALLGPLASGLLVCWLLAGRRRWRASLVAARHDHVLVLCALTAALLLVRFVLLPDELEYALLLVPLLLIALVRVGVATRRLAILAIALFVPNLVQVHLFVREPDGSLRIAPGLSPGSIVQDRSARLLNVYVDTNLLTVMKQVALQHGRHTFQAKPSTKAGELVVIPQQSLRFYDRARHGGSFYAVGCSQTIVVYPMPAHRAWRQLTRFDEWHPLSSADFRDAVLPGCDSRSERPPQG